LAVRAGVVQRRIERVDAELKEAAHGPRAAAAAASPLRAERDRAAAGLAVDVARREREGLPEKRARASLVLETHDAEQRSVRLADERMTRAEAPRFEPALHVDRVERLLDDVRFLISQQHNGHRPSRSERQPKRQLEGPP